MSYNVSLSLQFTFVFLLQKEATKFCCKSYMMSVFKILKIRLEVYTKVLPLLLNAFLDLKCVVQHMMIFNVKGGWIFLKTLVCKSEILNFLTIYMC